MTKQSEKRAWEGWICHPCATKSGYVYPEGHVSSCVFATCPVCGEKADLTPITDYRRKENGQKKER